MTSEQIVLFDIPTRERTTWSFNPWKSELLGGIPQLVSHADSINQHASS